MKKHFSALALSSFILSACNVSSDPTEDVESTSDDLKFYPISINPLAGKPMSGSWSKTSGADNDSTVCRECSYTNHSDFPHDQYPLAFDFNTWKASFPRFGSSTGMPEALTEGKAIADDLIGGSYNSALEENLCYAWAYLAVGQTQRGGSLTPSVSKLSHSITVTSYLNSLGLLAPQAICGSATLRQEIAQKVFQSNQAWALAFPPQYARHLKSQYLPSGLGYSNHVYAEPECLAEMDGRASKSYCSMREAAQRAGGSKLPLGNHQIGQFLFWEVGKVDGNLRFLPPSKIKEIDPYPNTKAYVIPMVVSGAVNPLTGPLLPEFSDLTHPLVWVTADGQYESQEVWGKTGVRYVGTWPNIHLEPVYGWTKRYDNMAHADYLAGRSRTARIALQDVTLFTIWEVLNVNLGVSMDFELGVPKTDHELRQGAAPTRSVNLDPSQGTVFASDGQIKRGTSTVGWPPLYVYGPNGLYPGSIPDSSLFGTRVRYDQEDDRAQVVRDRITDTLTLGADVTPTPVGPIQVRLDVDGSISVASQMDTVFREHLSATPQGGSLHLQSNAMAEVERTSDVAADPLSIRLIFTAHFDLVIGSFDVEWSKELYNAGTLDLFPKYSRSLEAEKLRVGEFSQLGLSAFNRDAQQPTVFSHLPDGQQPGGEQFQAFPASVGQCLAEPVDVPQAEEPTPPSYGGDVDPQLCLVFSGDFAPPGGSTGLPPRIPGDVCSAANKSAFVDAYMAGCVGASCLPERTCIASFVEFGCEQGIDTSWGGISAHSREVNATDANEMMTIVHSCAGLHATRDGSRKEALIEEFNALYSLTLCEDEQPIGNPHS